MAEPNGLSPARRRAVQQILNECSVCRDHTEALRAAGRDPSEYEARIEHLANAARGLLEWDELRKTR